MMWAWLQWLLSTLFPHIWPSITHTNDSLMSSGRPLGRFERYYCFAPLQRIFCVSLEFNSDHSLPDSKQLAAAIQKLVLIPGFGTFGCHIIDSNDEKAARWSAPKDLSVLESFVLRGITVNQSTSLDDIVKRELSTDFDLNDSSVPLWRFVLVPKNHSIVLTIQHVLTDAAGALQITKQLLQQLANNSPSSKLISDIRIPAPIEQLVPTYLTPMTLFQTVQRLLSKKAKSFVGSLSTVQPNSLSNQVAFRQLSTEQTRNVLSNAKLRDTTVHGALIAASARALNKTWSSVTSPFSVCSTINLRPFMPVKHDHVIGNCFTSFERSVSLPTNQSTKEISDSAWQFSLQYVNAMKSSVMHEWQMQDNILRLVCALGVNKTLKDNIAKLHNLRSGTLEVLNGGSFDLPGVSKLNVVQRTNHDSPLLLIGVFTVNQRINISLSYSSPLVSDHEAGAFLDALQVALTESD